MSTSILESLPISLASVQTQPLLAVRLAVEGPIAMGKGPAHDRRIGVITGGRFESHHSGLTGRVHSGGSDWQTVMSDGTWTLDVRLVLETDGGDLIGMTYRGYRHGPPEVLARLSRGETVDPSEYYFRSAPLFETSSERFWWLNRAITVAKGHRFPDGPVYNVFEVL